MPAPRYGDELPGQPAPRDHECGDDGGVERDLHVELLTDAALTGPVTMAVRRAPARLTRIWVFRNATQFRHARAKTVA